MKEVYDMLEKIEQAQGTNRKLELLAELIRLPSGEDFLRLVFSDDVLGVDARSFEKILDYKEVVDGVYFDCGALVLSKSHGNTSFSMHQIKGLLKRLKNTSGNTLLDELRVILDLVPIEAKWITRLILKDLKSGISVISFNKVLKEAGKAQVEKFEVQLCGLLDYEDLEGIKKKIVFPAGAGIKYDGERAILEKTDSKATLTSRQGKNIDYVPEIIKAAEKELPNGIALDGEILCKTFNEMQKRLGRKLENITPIEGLHFRIFDILKLDGQDVHSFTQTERWSLINSSVVESNNFKLEEKKIVHNIEELLAFFEFAKKKNEEGIVVKLLSKPYDYDSRKNWFKLKPRKEKSFKIVDFKLGTGKYAGLISTIVVENKSGTIKSGVGSGLSENDIFTLMNLERQKKLIGMIVDIIYNEVSTDASGNKSLRFPRFSKFRTDLSEPDE